MKGGWVNKKLEDVCVIERGGSPRPIQKFITGDPNGINWIKIGDATASEKFIYKTEERIKPEGAKRSRMVFEGDFILSNSMSFGRPYIMKTTGCIHDGWLVLRPREPKINQDYLYYVLSSDLVFNQFDRLAAGSTVRNLNITLVKGVSIPVAPPSEQRRIVGILDGAFEGIATAKANAVKNVLNARDLLESYLRGILANPADDWVEKQLGDVCEKITQGPNPKYDGHGVDKFRVLKTKDLYDDIVYYDEADKVSEAVFNSCLSSELKNGDVLLAIVGQGSINKCNVFENKTSNRFIYTRALGLIRPKLTALSPYFLRAFLQSKEGKRSVDSGINGTSGQQVVTTTHLKALKIQIPPLKEQEKIIEKLNTVSAIIKKLESIYRHKIEALEALKKSLLHEAFNGELTAAEPPQQRVA